MPTIRDTVIQFLQQIRGTGEAAAQPRSAEGAMPRLPLSPGTQVSATVMGKLDNGMSLVRISSRLFAMELPPRVQTGDSLRLTFLNQDGRPTFALANQTLSGTPVTLSPAGQLVKRLMRDPAQDSVTSKSCLPAMERLMDGPPADTTRLAGRLRQALGESGLFYESHLQEWAMGERPIAQLLREPQAALSRPEAQSRAAEAAVSDRPVVDGMPSESTPSHMPAEDGAPEAIPTSQRERMVKETYGQLDPGLLKREVQDASPETPRPGVERDVKDDSPASSPLQGEIADARTLPLVRQQLNLLNSGVFLWQGEAWQGQPMEWEVREREAHPAQGEEHGWQTTLRLDLPNLGRVSGVISLEGKELRLILEAGSADSASLLGGRTGDLKDRLSAAGIEMKGVVVRHEEPEGA
jgi:hypothetical protein